jgi:hypothetical protein
MGALLQILLRALPTTSSHGSDVERETQVRVDYYCALCGNVTVEENDSHESKEHHEQRGGVGG